MEVVEAWAVCECSPGLWTQNTAVLQRRQQEHFSQGFSDAFQVKLHCKFIIVFRFIIFYNKTILKEGQFWSWIITYTWYTPLILKKISLNLKLRCAFMYSSFLLKYFSTYCWKVNMIFKTEIIWKEIHLKQANFNNLIYLNLAKVIQLP